MMISKTFVLPSILLLSVAACDSSNEINTGGDKSSNMKPIEAVSLAEADKHMEATIPTEGEVLAASGAPEATFDAIGLEYSINKLHNHMKESGNNSKIRDLIGKDLTVDKIVYSLGFPSGIVEEGGVFIKPHKTFMNDSIGDSNTGAFTIGASFTIIAIQDELAICNENSFCSAI